MTKLGTLATVLGASILSATVAFGAATTVREPAFGLPHIFADTDLELARENGREIAKDRLVQIILLARTGRGTIRQPFGILDPTTLDDDIEARRTAYTSGELNNMYQKLPQRERDAILEYCKGVNDTIDAIYATTLPEPLEVNILRNLLGLSLDLFGNATDISDGVDPFYAPPGGAWPNAGFQFTPEMVMAISVLEVRNFGLGGFDEATLLQELQALITKHGVSAGTEIWDDRNYLNDPLAPVSVPDATTPGYGGPLAKATNRAQAIEIASSYPHYQYADMSRRMKQAKDDRAEFAKRIGAWPMIGSYAWVIAANKSATGYPWLGGFPQTGIQTPSLMHMVENRSAEGTSNKIRGLGMEFAGAPLVLIGQSDTVAYTSTTAQLRVIDTFLETIINEDTDALRYSDEGTPTPLTSRVEIFRGASAPDRRNTFWRSHERGGNGGSRPIAQFIGDANGTSESGSASTLVDNQANFDNSFVGGYVAIIDRFRVNVSAGAGQIRQISAVPNAMTLQVGSPFTTAPDNSFIYVAVKPGNNILGVAIDSATWQEESTTALGFALMQRAESILDIRVNTRLMPSTHNFPSADNKPFNGIGTSGGNGNIMFITSGFSRKNRPDPRIPLDGTSASNPLIVSSGTVASATPTTLTAVGSPFTGDNYAPPAPNFRYQNPTQQGSEFIVSIVTGAGSKQTRRIASNTAGALTVEYPWGVDPSPGDTFEVYEIVAIPEAINPSEGYLSNWNNKSATADEGDDFGRQFRHIFILERLAAENAWDRNKQRQLNKDVAGLEGKGDFGRYLIPRLRQAVDAVGTGGNPAIESTVAALEAHQAAPLHGRGFIDPVTATTTRGEVPFLNSLVNRLALDIYGDEYAGAVGVPTGSRALNTVQHAIDSKAGDVTGSYAQSYAGDYFAEVPSGIDHFSCYKAKRTGGAPRFTEVTGVSLVDAFENGPADVKSYKVICAPADVDGSGVQDNVTHLMGYKLKNSLEPLKLADASVTDRFGTKTLKMVVKADRILVPSGKALNGAASAPPAGLDHYKCYKSRATRSEFSPLQSTITDQFETARTFDLKRVAHFCAPVNKNGEGITQPGAFLMCYKSKVPTGAPKVTKVEGTIHVNNQFGTDQRIDLVKEDELCVPATYNLPGLEGWEYTVRDSLAALVAAGGIPADAPRPNSTYNHPLAALFPGPPPSGLQFPPTPLGNRGTYEQIIDVGPVLNGEFIFPLGQSGHIEGTFSGVTAIDPNFTTLHPLWRDWRFAPLLHVSQDLEAGNADADADGVLDGYERWYYGNTAQAAASDTDADGSTLLQEFTNGSDPTDNDTDDDGALDGADAEPQDRLVQ
jgi:hypothetical protein